MRRNHLSITFVIAVVSILLFPHTIQCQLNDKPVAKPIKRKKPPEDQAHWKFFLDSLIIETRLVDPVDQRPLVMAELADAYWLIDQNQSKKLFTEAFDTALALETNSPVANVIARIAKRDRPLAMDLMKRLLAAKSEESNEAAKSFSTARELFKTDPKTAIELAKLSSVLGPSMSGLSFLFQVERTDPAGAEEIYAAYLNNLKRPGNFELGSVLFLAGYPLGYGEAYGGSNDLAAFTGFYGMRVDGLKPRPDLAAKYLQIAFVAITNTLRRAGEARNPDKDGLNALAFYAASYLFPEVQRYVPDAEGAWSGLYRQALTGTSEVWRAEVEQRLRKLREVRTKTSEQSGEDLARTSAKEKLQDIEKLSDTCSRNRGYADVSLAHNYTKEFTQARQIADRIEDLTMRDEVLQFINYDEAAALIKSGDLVRAAALVEKVAAKEQRAVLYAGIAGAALKKSDKAMVVDVLTRARTLVRDSDDAELQAGVLLSVGAIYAQFDPTEATYTTRDSVKAINRMKERLTEPFSVLRRVNFGCVGGDIGWYGERNEVENSSLYETLGAIAKTDAQAEGALALASEIQDKPTRLRAQLAIVKAVIK